MLVENHPPTALNLANNHTTPQKTAQADEQQQQQQLDSPGFRDKVMALFYTVSGLILSIILLTARDCGMEGYAADHKVNLALQSLYSKDGLDLARCQKTAPNST